MSTTDNVLALNIPLEAAVNKAEVEEAQAKKRKRIEETAEKETAEGAGGAAGRGQQGEGPAGRHRGTAARGDAGLMSRGVGGGRDGARFSDGSGSGGGQGHAVLLLPAVPRRQGESLHGGRDVAAEQTRGAAPGSRHDRPDTAARAPGVSSDSPFRAGEVAMPEDDAAADAAAGAGAAGSGTLKLTRVW